MQDFVIISPIINLDGMKLRRVHPSRAEEVFLIINSQRERLIRRLPWVKYIQCIEDEFFYFKKSIENWNKGLEYSYLILIDDRVVGSVGGHSVNLIHQTIELGFWLSEEYSGRGIVSKTCAALVEHFHANGFYRIEIRCDPTNIASLNVAKRLGFIHEGTLRKSLMHGNELRDTMVWSKLRDD